MRPKDAFGRYGCVPRELHPAWFELTYYARAIAMDLFSRVDDFDQLSVITHGPWMDSLCKQLAIPGKERRNAKRAMQQLVDGGFLRAEEGRVCLVLVPSPAPSLSPGCPVPRSVPLPVVVSKSSEVVENTQLTKDSQPAIKASERETRARTRDDRFERPPVGEAPPNTPRSEPAPIRPEARCWQLYQRALGTEHLMLPPNHHDALSALASAAKAEADGATHGDAFDRAAQRILAAWMGEPYWREKDRTPFLRNLKERLEAGKYAVAKQKPSVAKIDLRSLSDEEFFKLAGAS